MTCCHPSKTHHTVCVSKTTVALKDKSGDILYFYGQQMQWKDPSSSESVSDLNWYTGWHAPSLPLTWPLWLILTQSHMHDAWCCKHLPVYQSVCINLQLKAVQFTNATFIPGWFFFNIKPAVPTCFRKWLSFFINDTICFVWPLPHTRQGRAKVLRGKLTNL